MYFLKYLWSIKLGYYESKSGPRFAAWIFFVWGGFPIQKARFHTKVVQAPLIFEPRGFGLPGTITDRTTIVQNRGLFEVCLKVCLRSVAICFI